MGGWIRDEASGGEGRTKGGRGTREELGKGKKGATKGGWVKGKKSMRQVWEGGRGMATGGGRKG